MQVFHLREYTQTCPATFNQLRVKLKGNMQSNNNALHFYSACLWQLSGSLQTLMNSQRQRFREYKGQKGL